MSFNAVNSLVNLWGQGMEDRIPELWFQEINKKDTKILEVGFGKGSMLKRLSRADGPELYGLDASQQNYRNAVDNFKVNAHLSLIDIAHERFQFPDGFFDTVILLEVLEHVENPMHVILEIQRVLKKDGIFIFSWPEERLISGIGMEENQTKRSHDDGFHSFPYPGLFRYDMMRVFLNQMYFKVVDEERQESYHICFKMLNKKPDRMHILDIVNLDADRAQLYSDIETSYKYPELVPFLAKDTIK
jgi:ubiquinone/menaquinone biosynthesis C-methylase UbiE